MADNDIAFFSPEDSDRIIKGIKRIEKRSFGDFGSGSNIDDEMIIRLDSQISGSPGKYNATAFGIVIAPAAGSLTLNQLRESTNTGDSVEAWNWAEVDRTTHAFSSFSSTTAGLGTLIGFNNTTNKYIFRVFITSGLTPGTQKYQVPIMISNSTWAWDYVRCSA